jgi:predicted ribonuclease YlaK
LIEREGEREIILVPDTNSLISAPDLAKYSTIIDTDTYTIILVPTVLNELDSLKILHRNQDVRDKSKSIIKRIKGLRNQGSLLKGVLINKSVTVRTIAKEPNFNETIHWLDSTNNDDRIIASILEIQCSSPSSIVILVTSDINLQNKAEMANLPFLEPPETFIS